MYRINKDKIFWRKVEDETVILNIDRGFYYTLDEIGTLIWEMIAASKDEEAIAQDIADSYDVDERSLEKDITSFLKNITKEGLIYNG